MHKKANSCGSIYWKLARVHKVKVAGVGVCVVWVCVCVCVQGEEEFKKLNIP
jgi:hypothetical protein